MEGPDASFNWEWQDELLASLDTDSPLGHTLWEDITQSEEILEATPASKYNSKDHESLWDVQDADSPYIKRRRMLNFKGEEDDGVLLSNCSFEPSRSNSFENLTEMYYGAQQNGDVKVLEPTSFTSIWFNIDDNDIENVKRCDNGDWLTGSVTEKECKPQQYLGRENQQLPLIFESTATKKDDAGKSTRTMINAISHVKRNLSAAGHSMPSNKMTTPVVYPFEVVKPSGMQGDATLNDINKHIMMVHDHTTRSYGVNGSCIEACGNGGLASNLLPKSVVALTKIHTEGNGTITIMRTKK